MRSENEKVPSKVTGDAARDLLELANKLPDPRMNRRKLHLLGETVVVAVTAVMCGADNWISVTMIAKELLPWFRQFLALENGIPSHDTFGRVFRLLGPDALMALMAQWVERLEAKDAEGEEDDTSVRQVAIDGKTSRRSHDRAGGKPAMHMLNVYATRAGLVLACKEIEEKSNEIPAAPEIIRQLDLKDAVVTLDAMGCQKETAQAILDGKADYVLALKGNQGNLSAAVCRLFEEIKGHEKEYDDVKVTSCRKTEKGHGRVETREYFMATHLGAFPLQKEWPGFHGAIRVHSTRTENGETTEEDRYYITSRACGVREVAKYIRGHWKIENCLHWVLDIAFREDECRVRKDNGPANFAILRRFALNLVKRDTTCKVGVAIKRLRALANADYRKHLLLGAL
jgi:predicted transposase YbfD/YdcC